MQASSAAARAAFAVPPNEVDMTKALKVECASSRDVVRVTVPRSGKPDLQFNGRLLLTVETERKPSSGFDDDGERWRVYKLYESSTARLSGGLMVVEEGHSTVPGEVTKHAAYRCDDGAEAWSRMGGLDEVKWGLAQVGHPAIEVLDDF